jgi:hypothetical protein
MRAYNSPARFQAPEFLGNHTPQGLSIRIHVCQPTLGKNSSALRFRFSGPALLPEVLFTACFQPVGSRTVGRWTRGSAGRGSVLHGLLTGQDAGLNEMPVGPRAQDSATLASDRGRIRLRTYRLTFRAPARQPVRSKRAPSPRSAATGRGRGVRG